MSSEEDEMGHKVAINSDMCTDSRIVEIEETDPKTAFLWPWFLFAFDDWGRAENKPKILKARLFPAFDDITSADVQAMIETYCRTGLLIAYSVDSIDYIAVPRDKWFRYQTHIPQDKRDHDRSRFPAPPQDISTATPGFSEPGIATPGFSEPGPAFQSASPSPPPPPPPSPSPSPSGVQGGEGCSTLERETLQILQGIEGYKYNYTKDLELLRKLSVLFPQVDLKAEIDHWSTYVLDKPLKPTGNHRSRLRNWVEYAVNHGKAKLLAPPAKHKVEFISQSEVAGIGQGQAPPNWKPFDFIQRPKPDARA
jgi:hypothetical protein